MGQHWGLPGDLDDIYALPDHDPAGPLGRARAYWASRPARGKAFLAGLTALVLVVAVAVVASPDDGDGGTAVQAAQAVDTQATTTTAPEPETTTTLAAAAQPTTAARAATAAARAPTTTRPRAATATTRPPTTTPPAAVAATAAPSCHASYAPCILDTGTDVDCAGKGDGPRYVSGSYHIHGPDEYDLDSNGNKYGCDEP
jgi:hypothetical protein